MSFEPLKKRLEDMASVKEGGEVPTEMTCKCGHTKSVTPEEWRASVGFYICDECVEKDRIEIERREKAEREATERIEAQRREDARKRRGAYIEENTPEMFKHADIANVSNSQAMNDSPVFIAFGNFGTGKTYAAYALAKDLMSRAEIQTFRVVRAFRMMVDIKSSYQTNSFDKVFNDFIKTGLLVIDEYGKNHGTDYEESMLYEIINTRYESRKRTGIIINAKNKEELMTLIRPDVLDRFRGGLVEFAGKSRR